MRGITNMISFIELQKAHTQTGRKCDKCGELIKIGETYLHMNKNKHLFMLCGKCIYIFAAKMYKENPLIKADATAELLDS